jgi:hypothetical protein
VFTYLGKTVNPNVARYSTWTWNAGDFYTGMSTYTWGGLFPDGMPQRFIDILEPDMVINTGLSYTDIRAYLKGTLSNYYRATLGVHPENPEANLGLALVELDDFLAQSNGNIAAMLNALNNGNLSEAYNAYKNIGFPDALNTIRNRLSLVTRAPFFWFTIAVRDNPDNTPFVIKAKERVVPIPIPSPVTGILLKSIDSVRLAYDDISRFTAELPVQGPYAFDLNPNKLDFSKAKSPQGYIDALRASNSGFLALKGPTGAAMMRSYKDRLDNSLNKYLNAIKGFELFLQSVNTHLILHEVGAEAAFAEMCLDDMRDPAKYSTIDGRKVNLSAWFDSPPANLLTVMENKLNKTDSSMAGLFGSEEVVNTGTFTGNFSQPGGSVYDGGDMDFGMGAALYNSYLYVIGRSSSTEAILVKYDESGNVVSSAAAIGGWDVAVNGNGVYVTGQIGDADGFITAKYDHNLVFVSSAVLLGDTSARALTLDAGGSVYVIGGNWGESGSQNDYKFVKYSKDLAQIGSPVVFNAGGSDEGRSIAVDSGNIYITGDSLIGGTTYFVTAKYNSSMAFVSSVAYAGGYVSAAPPTGEKLAVNANTHEVYFTGAYGTESNKSGLTIRYSPNLVQLSTAVFSVGNGEDMGQDIALDNAGNVYTLGLLQASGGENYAALFKYDSNLILVSSATQAFDYGYAPVSLAIDTATLNSYVTGIDFGALSGGESQFNMRTVRFAPLGGGQMVHAKGADEFVVKETDLEDSGGFPAYGGGNFLVGYRHNGFIRAQLMTPDGASAGSEIVFDPVNEYGSGAWPRAAFDGTNFLLAWVCDLEGYNGRLRGQFISTAGDKVGSPFWLSATVASHSDLGGIAFDGTNYFAVWRASDTASTDPNIYGQFVSQNIAGALIGEKLVIGENVRESAVAFGNGKYLAAWRNGGDGGTIVTGRLIEPNRNMGSEFVIDASPYMMSAFMGIAADNTRFLVPIPYETVGENPVVSPFFGRFVYTNGTVDPSTFTISDSRTPFLPVPVWDGSKYLISWNDARVFSTATVHMRYFDASGNSLSDDTVIASGVSGKIPLSFGFAYDSADKKFFSAINRYSVASGLGSDDTDVYGLIVATTTSAAGFTGDFSQPGGSVYDGGDMDFGMGAALYNSSLYVVGVSSPIGGIIAKYDLAGSILSSATFSGVDIFTGIKTNANGVYATAQGKNTGFVTVKYTHNLVFISSAVLPGDTSARDLALDAAGNVYVIGANFGELAGTNSDYKFVKYGPNLKQIGSPVTFHAGVEGEGRGIAVDNGFVYITGTSNKADATASFVTAKFNSTSMAFVSSVSYAGGYSPAKTSYWSNKLAINPVTHDVYFVGTSGTDGASDILTIRYSQNLQQLGLAAFSGASYDNGSSVTLDKAGNVYTLGKNQGLSGPDYAVLLKYNPGLVYISSAARAFTNGYFPIGIALDTATGNSYVTGADWGAVHGNDKSLANMRTVRFDPLPDAPPAAGTFTGDFSQPGGAVYAQAAQLELEGMAVDDDNNRGPFVYVTGKAFDIVTGQNEGLVIKYSSAGVMLASATISQPYADVAAQAVVVNSGNGDVYVAGSAIRGAPFPDYSMLVRYNAGLTVLSSATHAGVDLTMAMDEYHNLLTGGFAWNAGNKRIWNLARFDASLNYLGGSLYAPALGSVQSVSFDKQNNPLVVGSLYNSATGKYDWLVRKYDPALAILMVPAQQYVAGLSNDMWHITALAERADASAGNIYLTGPTSVAGTLDYVTREFDTSLNFMKQVSYASGVGRNDEPLAAAFDRRGNVIVTGMSYGSSYSDNPVGATFIYSPALVMIASSAVGGIVAAAEHNRNYGYIAGGGGGEIHTGRMDLTFPNTGVLSGAVRVPGGTPNGTVRVQLFRFNASANTLKVPVSSAQYSYVSSTQTKSVAYAFNNLPYDNSVKYLVKAFVDANANSSLDPGEARGQTKALGRGISVSDLAEQNFSVCAGTAIVTGQNLSGTLAASDCLSADRGTAPSFMDYYLFTGVAGDTVTVEMTGTGFYDTYLYLYGPSVDGALGTDYAYLDRAGADRVPGDYMYNLVAADDNSAGDGNSRITDYPLPAAGIYAIGATSYGSGITGAYTVSLRVARGTPGSIDGTVQYKGVQGGSIKVGLYNSDPRNPQGVSRQAISSMTVPGAFTFSDLPSGATYYIGGFIDVNGNNSPDTGEDFGMLTSTFPSGGKVIGLKLVISSSTDAGVISGSITYTGASISTPLVIGMWNSNAFAGAPVRVSTKQVGVGWSPASYRLTAPVGRAYYLQAFLDGNNNRLPDPDEAKGVYGPNNQGPEPVYVNSTVSKIDIVLYNPGQSGPGAAGEGWATVLPAAVSAGSQFTSTIAVRVTGLAAGGGIMVGLPGNIYTPLQKDSSGAPGNVRVHLGGAGYDDTKLTIMPPYAVKYTVPAGQSVSSNTYIYFEMQNLYAPCQGAVTGSAAQQSDNQLKFYVATSSNAATPRQPLVSGEPAAALMAGTPQSLSFRLADSANTAGMAVPNGVLTAMLAEARDNCRNLASMSSSSEAAVSAYNMATAGYDKDPTVQFSTWIAAAGSVTVTSATATMRFDVNRSSAVFYLKPLTTGYKNIGLSYNLSAPNTSYMGVQVMSGSGINDANVSLGAYNNLSVSSVTITPGGAAANRAYINFLLGDINIGWHVLVSAQPLRAGVAADPVWETWGWGQPNPGQLFWEGRYSPWINFGGMAPAGAYFVRIEAGGVTNDNLRITVDVPKVYGQVTDDAIPPQLLSGVAVNAFGLFGWGQATTDSNGYFSIPGLAAGPYKFQFSKEGYAVGTRTVAVGTADTGMGVVSMPRATALTLIPALDSGTTQQYDQWGWISVHTSDWSRSYSGGFRVQAGTTTIDDGGKWDSYFQQFITHRTIRFEVEAATYTVEAELSGYGRISTTAYVGQAGLVLAAPANLPSFKRKADVSGRVTILTPSANSVWVSVNALPVTQSTSVTGGWGSAVINPGATSGVYGIFGLDVGSYTVRAQALGYLSASTGPVSIIGNRSDLNLQLGNGARIQGAVTVVGKTSLFQKPDWAASNSTQPIRVNINVWSPRTYTNGWTEVLVSTDLSQARSTFTITGLNPGTTYQLFANMDYNAGSGNAEFTVPGGFPKQVYISTISSIGPGDFSFELASGRISGTITLPADPAPDFREVSMGVRVTQSDNPYNFGQSYFIPNIVCGSGQTSNCLPGLSTTTVTIATFSITGMETQAVEITFTYRLTGMSRTTVVNVVSGSTAAIAVNLGKLTYSIGGSIANQISNPLFNTMDLAIKNSSFTFPSGYPSVPTTLPIEAVRRDLNEFGVAISTTFNPAKIRAGFITRTGTYTISGLQEGVYVVRTLPLMTCATCDMLVAAQEKVVTVGALDYTNHHRVLADGVYVDTGAVNFTLIDGWNVSGAIAISPDSVRDSRTLRLTLRNRRNEVVRSTAVALGNAATNSLANLAAYSFTRLPGGEFYTLEVRDTKDSSGTIKYAASPIRFPDIGASPNGLRSDLSAQNITLRQGAMLTLKLRDVNSASLLTQSNVTLLAPNFSCYATANPWVQGGYYVAASSVSGRPIEADGTVRIGPVMPGVYYDVKCEQSSWDVGLMRSGAQNYSPAVVSGVRPSAGEARNLGVLDLKQGQALSGGVRGRAGQALANIKVIARPSYIENPMTIQAITNSDGRYTLWVSTYVSRYFDITAAPWEQNQNADVSTIVYRESAYKAVDLTRSSATVDFTLDVMLGGVNGNVVTVDSGALSYPFGEMQGFPAAALFIQPYGTVPQNNPIGDIEAITEPGGAFSVPLATGSYTMNVVSLGYSVSSFTFTVQGSGMVNIGTMTLVKGGTVTGQIRKPDSTAPGGYTEPNSDEISLVLAANDSFTKFVMGTVVSDSVSRTITRYTASGFETREEYHLALMSDSGDLTFPSEGDVLFSQDESTVTKSVNLTFRPNHGDCMAVRKKVSAGMQIKFVCSKALRNMTADDNSLSLMMTTSPSDSLSVPYISPNGTGSLSARELSSNRKQFTAIYNPAAGEGAFSVRLAAYLSEIDPATGENFRIDRVYDFYTGVKAETDAKVNNMRGGRVELEGDEDEDERGAAEFSPGTFSLVNTTYTLHDTTCTVRMRKSEDLAGALGVSALAAGGSGRRLESIRHTLPGDLYEAMQALREGRVGNYRTKASASASVDPISAFYDIALPAGISHVLQQPARITLSYDAALSSGNPSGLNVYYYNPGSRRYVLESVGRTVDTDNATISVNVDHLSVFVVLAQSPVEGATANEYTGDKLKAHNFPNPFNNTRSKSISLNDAIAAGGYSAAAVPCVTQGTCVRVFIPRGTSGEMYLKIFNIAGELVRDMQLTGYSAGTTNVWPWDGMNGSGEKVASGVYIGEVKVGSDKAFFKMAVIKSSKYQ